MALQKRPEVVLCSSRTRDWRPQRLIFGKGWKSCKPSDLRYKREQYRGLIYTVCGRFTEKLSHDDVNNALDGVKYECKSSKLAVVGASDSRVNFLGFTDGRDICSSCAWRS